MPVMRNRKALNNDPYYGLPFNRKKYVAVDELAKLLKRRLLQNFNKLKLESVTYKRERMERRHLKIIQVENIIKRKLLVIKMQFMQSLKNHARE
jgi:hypothetical protein